MRTLTTFAAAAAFLAASAQLNMTQLGHLDYQALRNTDLSNIWGYTDEFGNEYALVGVNGSGGNTGGLSVVDVTDPANPQEVAFVAAPTSIWREIKTYGDHAYITTEASLGLLIVDLSPLPGSTSLPSTVFQGVGWDTSHSLFIDENGRLYLNGSNRGNGGVIMYDLTVDPMAPVEVGSYDPWYCHDCFARGDTLYAAHIYDGFFSMVDVSDPANPVLLGTQSTPNTFSHNVWLDDTGDHLFTTDEVSGAFVGAYDVSDPGDILFQDKLQSDPGSGTIPHNTYWLNDFLVTSYYTYGVTVYDATYPHHLVETAHFDTYPGSGDGFNGAWGVYPFAPSGNLFVSDINTGLWILAPDYVHACWLEGNVTNSITSAPVNAATITVLGPSLTATTGFDGHFATGTATAGTYDVLFEAVGYFPQTITGVLLQNGVLTIQDAALVPMVPFNYGGQVVNAGDGTGVPGAFVSLAGTDTTYTTQANASGNFTFTNIFAGTYTATAGQWGWITDCSFSGNIDPLSPPLVITLNEGWYDDFTFDYSWVTGTTATTGAWVREEPIGTTSGGDPCNPELDVDADCGDRAYVTGNGGGGAGDDDVDDGYTRLTSPVFDLSGYLDPYVECAYWFYNGGGFGSPNDVLTLSLANGSDTVAMATLDVNTATLSEWTAVSARVLDLLPATPTMRLIVRTADDTPGHLVEAGLDHFRVRENWSESIAETGDAAQATVLPNPNNGTFMLRVPFSGAQVRVVDAQGRVVLQQKVSGSEVRFVLAAAPGVYAARIEGPAGRVSVVRFVVERP